MDNLDPDLLESIILGNNQAPTTELSNYENPVVPSFLLADPNLPPQLPNTPSIILNEALPDGHFSSMVGLMPEETASQIQEQDMAAINNPFYDPLNDNLLMFQDSGRSNEYNYIDNQLLVPNINDNNIFNGINHNSSNYPPMLQYPVEEISGIGTGILTGQIMTSQTPTLPPLQNEHITNSHMMWSYRPEQAIGVQLQQVTPVYASTITTQRDGSVALEPPPSRLPSASSVRQNAMSVVSSNDPSTFVNPPQNQRLNLQNRRERTRDELAVTPNRSGLMERREEQPCRAYTRKHLEIGGSSSSKRHKKDSSIEVTASKEPKTQEANKTPENVMMKNQNENITTSSSIGYPRNGLYDPRYQIMGLPIDPHIRLWKAQQDPQKYGYYPPPK